MNLDDEMRELARRTAALATLEDLTRILGARGIACLSLKGAALVLDVYPEHTSRPLTDVDVLVDPLRFREAVAALEASGYAVTAEPPHAYSRTFRGRVSPLAVDLHGALYSRALFRMPAHALFARAVKARALEHDVLRPHGLDLVAHAVGHYVKTRPPLDTDVLGRDITFAMARDGLDATRVAAHLVELGLARAARYALPRITDPASRAVANAILEALPPDPLAKTLVAVAKYTEHARLETLPSVLSRHVLNESLPRGLLSFGYQALDAAASRARRRFSRRP